MNDNYENYIIREAGEPGEGSPWCSKCEHHAEDCTCECEHKNVTANMQADKAAFPHKCADCGRVWGPDFRFQNEGSIYLVTPLNDAADQHLLDHVSQEAQWWGGSLVVEHRYVEQLAERLQEEGFKLCTP